MRIKFGLAIALSAMVAMMDTAVAQHAKNPSSATTDAGKHYANGWEAIRSESWDAASREFQRAIDIQPRFALAYYSLGRAEMGRKNFAAAIVAYTKCRELYQSAGGEQLA